MNHRKNSIYVSAALDRFIDEITVDAYGDDEQLWAFRQAFEDDVILPADGFVIDTSYRGRRSECIPDWR